MYKKNSHSFISARQDVFNMSIVSIQGVDHTILKKHTFTKVKLYNALSSLSLAIVMKTTQLQNDSITDLLSTKYTNLLSNHYKCMSM